MKLKLSEISKINGASGNEKEVISYIQSMTGGKIDNLGTLIAGDGKVAVAMIADEKGVFVSENGSKIRICPIGAAKPAELVNRKIVFPGGEGVVCCDKDLGEAKNSDLYVVSGVNPEIGEIGCVESDTLENDEFIITKAFGRTASVGVGMKLFGTKNLKLMFTTMFYNGKKGLNAALYNEKTEYTVLIDTVNADGEKVKLGEGPVIKMMDGSYTADAHLRAFAKNHNCQKTVIKTPEIRCVNNISFGAAMAVISVPVQYMGGYVGKILLDDIEKTAEFTKEFIKTIY